MITPNGVSAQEIIQAFSSAREVPASSFIQQIEIPELLGKIEEMFQAACPKPHAASQNLEPEACGRQLVVHIQDAHANYEAQINTQKILNHLKTQYGFEVIFHEGGVGKLNPDNLKFLEDAGLNRKVVDLLTHDGIVSGAERFLLEDEKAAGFGVEEPKLYQKNLNTFRAVIGEKENSEAYLEKLKSQIVTESSRVFNKQLRQFFREWVFYQDTQSKLMPHLQGLSAYAKKELKVDLTDPRNQLDWPQLLRIFTLKDLEKKIDSSKVESDKQKLIQWMKEEKIAEEYIQGVNTFAGPAAEVSCTGPSARCGSSRHGYIPRHPQKYSSREFLEHFYDTASSKGFSFTDYPDFSRWAGLVVLQSEIQAAKLFEETQQLTDEILNKLAQSPEEKQLIQKYKDYLLLKKLLNLELTSKEYEEILNRQTHLTPHSLFAGDADVKRLALQFYADAKKRDEVMLQNTLAQLKETSKTKAVLITGGFHSQGLLDKLKQNNISYLEITPRISEIDSANKTYEDLMMLRGQFLKSTSTIKALLPSLGLKRIRAIDPPTADFYAKAFQAHIEQVSPKSRSEMRSQEETDVLKNMLLGEQEWKDEVWKNRFNSFETFLEFIRENINSKQSAQETVIKNIIHAAALVILHQSQQQARTGQALKRHEIFKDIFRLLHGLVLIKREIDPQQYKRSYAFHTSVSEESNSLHVKYSYTIQKQLLDPISIKNIATSFKETNTDGTFETPKYYYVIDSIDEAKALELYRKIDALIDRTRDRSELRTGADDDENFNFGLVSWSDYDKRIYLEIQQMWKAYEARTPEIFEKLNSYFKPGEAEKVTRIIYPAARDDVRPVQSLIRFFPNIKQVFVIDPQSNQNYWEKYLLSINDSPSMSVQVIRNNFYETELPPMFEYEKTILIDKFPGHDAFMRNDPEYRKAILKHTRPGDFIFSVPFRRVNNLEWSELVSEQVELPYLSRYEWVNQWQIWRLREKDFSIGVPQNTVIAESPTMGKIVDVNQWARQLDQKQRGWLIRRLIELYQNAFKHSAQNSKKSWEYWSRVVESSSHINWVLLSEEEGEIKLLGLLSAFPMSGKVQLSQLGTIQDYQRGKGTFLLDVFFETMKKEDQSMIYWHPLESAIKFYENYLRRKKEAGLIDNYSFNQRSIPDEFVVQLFPEDMPSRSEIRMTAEEKGLLSQEGQVLENFLAAREKFDVLTGDWHEIKDEKDLLAEGPFDVMMVLGSPDERVPVEAARLGKILRQQNPQMKILTSGKWGSAHGFTVEFKNEAGERIPEAIHYKRIIEQEGVSVDLTEENSKNSGMNIVNSRELLRKEQIYPKRVLILQTPLSQKRAGATFVKQYPLEDETLASLGIESMVSYAPYRRDLAALEDEKLKIVIQEAFEEMERLRQYSGRFMVPVEIPEAVLMAENKLKDLPDLFSRSEMRMDLETIKQALHASRLSSKQIKQINVLAKKIQGGMASQANTKSLREIVRSFLGNDERTDQFVAQLQSTPLLWHQQHLIPALEKIYPIPFSDLDLFIEPLFQIGKNLSEDDQPQWQRVLLEIKNTLTQEINNHSLRPQQEEVFWRTVALINEKWTSQKELFLIDSISPQTSRVIQLYRLMNSPGVIAFDDTYVNYYFIQPLDNSRKETIAAWNSVLGVVTGNTRRLDETIDDIWHNEPSVRQIYQNNKPLFKDSFYQAVFREEFRHSIDYVRVRKHLNRQFAKATDHDVMSKFKEIHLRPLAGGNILQDFWEGKGLQSRLAHYSPDIQRRIMLNLGLSIVELSGQLTGAANPHAWLLVNRWMARDRALREKRALIDDQYFAFVIGMELLVRELGFTDGPLTTELIFDLLDRGRDYASDFQRITQLVQTQGVRPLQNAFANIYNQYFNHKVDEPPFDRLDIFAQSEMPTKEEVLSPTVETQALTSPNFWSQYDSSEKFLESIQTRIIEREKLGKRDAAVTSFDNTFLVTSAGEIKNITFGNKEDGEWMAAKMREWFPESSRSEMRGYSESKTAAAEFRATVRFEDRVINWDKAFGNTNPLVVEVGPRSGRVMLEMANQSPANRYIGIELISDYEYEFVEDASKLPQKNIRIIYHPAQKVIRSMFDSQSIDRILFMFPYPWAHESFDPQEHRFHSQDEFFFTEEFRDLLMEKLNNHGEIILVTENKRMAKYLEELFGEQPLFNLRPYSDIQAQLKGLGIPINESRFYQGNTFSKLYLFRVTKEELISRSELRSDASKNLIHDLLIVGAGPAGLMALTQALSLGLKTVILERNQIGTSWQKIPEHLIVSVKPRDFVGMESQRGDISYRTRRQVTRFLEKYVDQQNLRDHIHENLGVESIQKRPQGFYEVLARDPDPQTGLAKLFYTWGIAVATGIFHQPRKLGVKNEDAFPKKIVRVIEDVDLELNGNVKNQHYVIVGSGNTALKVAQLFKEKKVGKVTMIFSTPDFIWQDKTRNPVNADPKYREMIESWKEESARAKSPKLEIKSGMSIERFTREKIYIHDAQGNEVSLPYDKAFLCVGFKPNLDFLEAQGVGIDHGNGYVMMDRTRLLAQDFERNSMPNFYILGVDVLTGGGVAIGQMASQAAIVTAQVLAFREQVKMKSRVSKEPKTKPLKAPKKKAATLPDSLVHEIENYENLVLKLRSSKEDDFIFTDSVTSQPGDRIGFYAISGNPITINHKEIVQRVMREKKLDSVIVIVSVSHANPEKQRPPKAVAESLAMIEAAFKDMPNVYVGMTKKGKYVDFARLANKTFPPNQTNSRQEIYLMMGVDNFGYFLNLHTKEEIAETLQRSKIIINSRGSLKDKAIREIKKKYADKLPNILKTKNTGIEYVDVDLPEISSSLLRVLIADGEEKIYEKLVGKDVARIIKARGLYKDPVSEQERIDVFRQNKEVILRYLGQGDFIHQEPWLNILEAASKLLNGEEHFKNRRSELRARENSNAEQWIQAIQFQLKGVDDPGDAWNLVFEPVLKYFIRPWDELGSILEEKRNLNERFSWAEDLPRVDQMKLADFSLIGKALHDIWREKGWHKQFDLNAHIAPLPTPIQSMSYRGSEDRLRALMSSDSLEEEMMADWMNAIAWVMHIRFYGMHLDEGDQRPVDNELLVKAVRSFIEKFLAWRKTSHAEYPLLKQGAKTEVAATFEDFMLWGLAAMLDPKVYDMDVSMVWDKKAILENLWPEGSEQSISDYLTRIFSNWNADTYQGLESLIDEILSRTDEDWEKAGLRSPWYSNYQSFKDLSTFFNEIYVDQTYVIPLMEYADKQLEARDIYFAGDQERRRILSNFPKYPIGQFRELRLIKNLMPQRISMHNFKGLEEAIRANRTMIFYPSDVNEMTTARNAQYKWLAQRTSYLADDIAEMFGENKIEMENDSGIALAKVLRELIRNAVVHGNQLDFNKPFMIRMELNSDNRLTMIRIFDSAVKEKADPEAKRVAFKYYLFGQKKGVEIIKEHGWIYQRVSRGESGAEVVVIPPKSRHIQLPNRSELRHETFLFNIADNPDVLIPPTIRFLDRFLDLAEQRVAIDDQTGKSELNLRVPDNQNVYFDEQLILSSDFKGYNAYETNVPVRVEWSSAEKGPVAVEISLGTSESQFLRLEILKKNFNGEWTSVNPAHFIFSGNGDVLGKEKLLLRAKVIAHEEFARRSELRTRFKNDIDALIKKVNLESSQDEISGFIKAKIPEILNNARIKNELQHDLAGVEFPTLKIISGDYFFEVTPLVVIDRGGSFNITIELALGRENGKFSVSEAKFLVQTYKVLMTNLENNKQTLRSFMLINSEDENDQGKVHLFVSSNSDAVLQTDSNQLDIGIELLRSEVRLPAGEAGADNTHSLDVDNKRLEVLVFISQMYKDEDKRKEIQKLQLRLKPGYSDFLALSGYLLNQRDWPLERTIEFLMPADVSAYPDLKLRKDTENFIRRTKTSFDQFVSRSEVREESNSSKERLGKLIKIIAADERAMEEDVQLFHAFIINAWRSLQDKNQAIKEARSQIEKATQHFPARVFSEDVLVELENILSEIDLTIYARSELRLSDAKPILEVATHVTAKIFDLVRDAEFTDEIMGLLSLNPAYAETKSISEEAKEVLDMIQNNQEAVAVFVNGGNILAAGDKLQAAGLQQIFESSDLIVGENKAGANHIVLMVKDTASAKDLNKLWMEYLKAKYPKDTAKQNDIHQQVHIFEQGNRLIPEFLPAGVKTVWLDWSEESQQAVIPEMAKDNKVYGNRVLDGSTIQNFTQIKGYGSSLLQAVLLLIQPDESQLVKNSSGFYVQKGLEAFQQIAGIFSEFFAQSRISASA